MKVSELFLKYVAYPTASNGDNAGCPSTKCQRTLAEEIVRDLSAMGLKNVRADENCYIYAELPASAGCEKEPTIGFIAHIDVSDSAPCENIKPAVIENYDGGDIVLNPEKNILLSTSEYDSLPRHKGKSLIVTDGMTLLGADDKAGIAEIMAAADYLINNPDIPHGAIKIGFTPDEEIGRGADLFDVDAFGADFAYTVDGGELGEINYECFNAASAVVDIYGVSIHPGSAKGKMKNACLMAAEFASLLPENETPATTEGYEGFYHLNRIGGDEEHVEMRYILRDHDASVLEERKRFITAAAETLGRLYGDGAAQVKITDSYRNMREVLEDKMYVVERAEKAMRKLGVEPVIEPIRGGTDGARLSFEGLPCPNLSTGGYNFHGRFEYIPVEDMQKMVEVIVEIVRV